MLLCHFQYKDHTKYKIYEVPQPTNISNVLCISSGREIDVNVQKLAIFYARSSQRNPDKQLTNKSLLCYPQVFKVSKLKDPKTSRRCHFSNQVLLTQLLPNSNELI